MKTTRKFYLKLLFPFVLLLVFVVSTALLFTYRRDERIYTELTSELFKSELIPNTLNLHYTIAEPQNYGIYSYRASLPVYSRRQELASHARLENYLSSFQSLREDKLSAEDAYTLRLLLTYLENARAFADFPYYDEPLSPNSGMQTQLPILLAEYTFRCKRDVEDYLALLDQTDDYFAGLALYEHEKAAAGLFMPDYSLEKVRTQCDSLLDRKSLQEGTHFLQTTFEQRLQTLYEQGEIDGKELENYISSNNRLLLTVMLPAYESLSDALFLLEGLGENPDGLAHYPDGSAYYEVLLRQSTGSSRPIEEIKEMLYREFEKEYQTLKKLYAANPSLTEELSVLPDASLFPLRTPDEILLNLCEQISADFPAFPSAGDESSPVCTVKAVSENLAPFSAPAFYLTPPMDDSSQNVIYINEQDCPTGLALYTTLAHEGYPGHLYQSVYYQRYSRQKDLNPVRELMWYGGYQEGWALYTEFLSYDYAAQLMAEGNASESALACTLEKHNRSLQLCLYSILDVAIHYDGATLEDAAQVLAGFGITDQNLQQTIYEYIVEEPANYLKYYLGYLEIMDLQETARSIWGEGYTDLAFHKFILECGPSDFENLKKRLEDTPTPPASVPGNPGPTKVS